ncbi:hypothetical protein L1987_23187 [Smallanthus sonchifolius]|uniref:Uncharacterized protein n=1 Tax=Smallanthus sonchifolius TaxID=185202 RepID=A0ACB9IGR9_9ASTR|nr:hypothetical protein L1987_23187 [Smallanthus sonchifolius]
MSNHLICLEKHIFFAVVLNRLLVIPSAKVDYEFNRVLDIDHIKKCFIREVVVTFEEFAKNDDHVKKLKVIGVTMNMLKTVWMEDVKKPTYRTFTAKADEVMPERR